ncbi:predicted protein [Naegleria gruberi]|uniref:Predicted protein n=1 Tax=Naegleria gruberi TaxID=5762 RepID=D2VT45_NAEGR|nr:uncharacterized protein NAEGRDRAFT_52040 [Naegleria gruberi]EFC40083.1 predicted protein [Naegleria gruberi]|eukprot:XP_002672827.1 predicted protein [Naegleria gruberi strain NEG-M]
MMENQLNDIGPVVEDSLTTNDWTLEELRKLPWVVHGSTDSIDRDVIYWIPITTTNKTTPAYKRKLPSQKVCFDFCVENKLEENRNLIVIDSEKGIVIDCFKGTADAINNQIKLTYGYHEQKYECPVKDFVQRNIVLKMVRGVRQILSMVGRVMRIHKAKIRQRAVLIEFLGVEDHELVSELLDNFGIVHGCMDEDLTDLYHDDMKSNLKSLDFRKRVESVKLIDYSKICKQCILWEREFREKKLLEKDFNEELFRKWFEVKNLKWDNLMQNYKMLRKKQRNVDLPQLIQNMFESHFKAGSTNKKSSNSEQDFKTAGEEGDFLHIVKSIAFQMVQTDAQLENIELYSKRMVVDRDNRTQPLMYREMENMLSNLETCFKVLNEYRDMISNKLLTNLNVEIIENTYNIFKTIDISKEMSSFHQQCNSMLIDMKRERVACCPPIFLKTHLDSSLSLESLQHSTIEKLEFSSEEHRKLFFDYSKDLIGSSYWNSSDIGVLKMNEQDSTSSQHLYLKIQNFMHQTLNDGQLVHEYLNVKDYTYSFKILNDDLILISCCDLIAFKFRTPNQIQTLFTPILPQLCSKILLPSDFIQTQQVSFQEMKNHSNFIYHANGHFIFTSSMH